MRFNLKLGVCIVGLLGIFSSFVGSPDLAPRQYLSEYGFFDGPLANLTPVQTVFPYEVNAPLFSDYAEKARFIYLPPGTKLSYQAVNAFDFPTGAVIIKNFFYHHDNQHPELGRQIIETRLLIKTANTWKALDYIWNAEQTEATLEVAGAQLPVQWTDIHGKNQSIQYQIPNLNQCKGCHSLDGQFTPIGVTARQLNRVISSENQLLTWEKQGLLELPIGFDIEAAPRLADYRNAPLPQHESIERMARAYLDANCAHCHNPQGPASTSGLFLEADQQNPERLGVLKSPVAAGRGSGKYRYGIVPGKPQESILVYRMESNDPGIRMPELGRQIEHQEGIALVKAWIKTMQ